jgi:hypothetical protein
MRKIGILVLYGVKAKPKMSQWLNSAWLEGPHVDQANKFVKDAKE